MDNGFNIDAILGILRRRWWVLLAPVVIGTPLAFLVATMLPPTYQSSGRIIVVSQQIPEELAQTTITTSAAERIALIQQRLTTRNTLLALADRFRIYGNEPGMSPTQVIDRMRRDISISGVDFAGRSGSRVTAIDIAFQASQPALAAQVANELVSQVMEQNIGQRSAQAVETLGFFTQEAERLGAELNRLETEIALFKSRNADSQPDSLNFRRGELSALESRIFEREARRALLADQRLQIVEAIQSGELAAVTGSTSPELAEIMRLERERLTMSATYTPTHPQMRAIARRIEALRGQVSPEALNGEEEGAAATPASVQRELERIDREIATLDERLRLDNESRAALASSIERTPQVELELRALMREQDNVRRLFDAAVAKRSQAELGERLEVNRQGERFEIIEQPQTPTSPVSPNRPLIVAAGFVGSGVIGAALVVLLELMNRSLRTASDVERRLSMRPIVVIPYIKGARHTTRRRWITRAAVVLAIVTAPAALHLIGQNVAPLPLIAQLSPDETGLLSGSRTARAGG
jgi:polysaccharide chain length determinant protein (PEP-CTERM system associated)